MPLEIVRGDLAQIRADALVNTANPHPVVGYGVDETLHRGAGPELLRAREKIGDIAVGQAVISPAFDLKARWVIHTVGPVWHGGKAGEAEALRSCYANALALAAEARCKSVAFPLIATGTYGFPRPLALQIAFETIGRFVLEHEIRVLLVVFDPASFALSRKLVAGVTSFLDDTYVPPEPPPRDLVRERLALSRLEECRCPSVAAEVPIGSSAAVRGVSPVDLNTQLAEADASFSKALRQLILSRGLEEPQVYKRANIDRKLFSKIRSYPDYKPRKATVLALAIALRLGLEETSDLLRHAGYAMTRSSKTDIVVEYFIAQGVYDVFEINKVLFSFGLPLIGP